MSLENKRVEIGDATLILGDCVPFMRSCDDKQFDVAIVDPPYAVGANDGSFGRGGRKAIINSGSSAGYRRELPTYGKANEVPDADYFSELFRVSKHQIIWGANYYPQHMTHGGWIVWDKMKMDGLLSQAELAFQSFDKLVKIFKHEWEGFRKGPGSFEGEVTQTIHPNQKPVRLYEWLLQQYAKDAGSILDTHLGSASIAIATNVAGIRLTGIEIHEGYYEAACRRIEAAQAQGKLFEPARPNPKQEAFL